MSRDFERTICGVLEGFFNGHGYRTSTPCVFVREYANTRATVWLVEGQSSLVGQFMPRLSIGLNAIGDDVAVLSTDLHVLVSPEQTFWYPWKEQAASSIDRIRADLEAAGFPWLERHAELDELARVLEESVVVGKEPATIRRWWQLGGRVQPQPRVNSNSLKFLSFVREAQGRYPEALEWWRKYAATLTLVREGSDLDKELLERRQALERRL